MTDLLQRFSGNPFSTQVGRKIEHATDISLTVENWGLNMEICDIINYTEDGARDAVRAIRKRLQQTAGKNFTVFKLTLTVLETCVKNCGKRFHILVTNKDFVQELVKLIGPKNDPPAEIQEKVLNLIQSWAEAFHGQPDMQGVSIVYNELRNKGIEFPKSSNEPKVPIYTPQRISPVYKTPMETSSPSKMNPLPGTSPPNQMLNTRSPNEIHLTLEQLNKLKSELEMVQGNMKLFSQMLTELTPGQEHKDDINLLIELHKTLNTMQKRIVELIEKIANEEVTSELLRINDELNNLFMRFDRYQKKRIPGECQHENDNIDSIPSTSAIQKNTQQPTNLPSLIDFTDETDYDIVDNMKELDLNPPVNKISHPVAENMGDKEFDMFAQSRSTTVSNNQLKPESEHPKDKDTVLISTEQEQEKEMEEIERWLNTRPGEPSMLFEEFLERRANALDKQPLKKNSQDSSLI